MPTIFGWFLSCPQLYYDFLAHHPSVHILANEIVPGWIKECYSLGDSHLSFLDYASRSENDGIDCMEIVFQWVFFFVSFISFFCIGCVNFHFYQEGRRVLTALSRRQCRLTAILTVESQRSHNYAWKIGNIIKSQECYVIVWPAP